HVAPLLSIPLSLHDALPISDLPREHRCDAGAGVRPARLLGIRLRGRRTVAASQHRLPGATIRTIIKDACNLYRPIGPVPRFGTLDRKSTRLNSSHVKISYAV